MKGLDWGRFYETYHNNNYDADKLEHWIEELMADSDVTKQSGIYEYLLSGESPKLIKLLSIWEFRSDDKRAVYEKQTKEAKAKGVSNCPLCVTDIEHGKTKTIYPYSSMEGDHKVPWSKGGKSTRDNLQMLCKYHNKTKSGL